MTEQKKIGLAIVSGILLLLIGLSVKEYYRAQNVSEMNRELNAIFNHLQPKSDFADIESIGTIKENYSGERAFYIRLKPNMNHDKTKAMFPDNKWKDWNVFFGEEP